MNSNLHLLSSQLDSQGHEKKQAERIPCYWGVEGTGGGMFRLITNNCMVNPTKFKIG